MKKTFAVLVLTGIFMLTALPVSGQKVEDFVSKYTQENGKGYMQPLADAMGACLNSGWYRGAHIPMVGLHLTIGVETMWAFIGSSAKTFNAQTGEFFYPPQTVKAPTLFGATQGVTATGTDQSGTPNGTVYAFPGGMNIKRLPILAPQVTIGSIMGTEATVRWFATSSVKDIGKIELIGWGLRHSISQYIPLLPVDLAAGFFTQSFKVGDIVEATSTLVGVQGSVSQSILVLYGGLGVEFSTLKISYDYKNEDVTETIKFDLKGKNKMRMTVGAGLNLPGIKIHADYNISSQSVLSAGIGIGI
jgi:hypothetical protein